MISTILSIYSHSHKNKNKRIIQSSFCANICNLFVCQWTNIYHYITIAACWIGWSMGQNICSGLRKGWIGSHCSCHSNPEQPPETRSSVRAIKHQLSDKIWYKDINKYFPKTTSEKWLWTTKLALLTPSWKCSFKPSRIATFGWRGELRFKHVWFAKGGNSTTTLNIVQNTEIVFEWT